jgi:hypothetical protein
MPWSIEYNADLKIISVTCSGEWTPEQDSRMLAELKHTSESRGCLSFLIDFRMVRFKFEFMSIYNRAEIYEGMQFSKDTRAALVVTKLMDNHSFYENVCVNRGFKVRLFESLEKATRWLVPAC